MMFDDVWLPSLSGNCFTGCERPNDPRQVRRWQLWRSAWMTARNRLFKSRQVTGRASGVTCTRLLGRKA